MYAGVIYIESTEQIQIRKNELTKKIKSACDGFLSSPNWDINTEICEELNMNPYLCGHAVGEIRLLLKTKNPEVELLALHLIEGIIKNCPASHGSIAQPDFIRYLVKVGLDQRKDGFWKGAAKKLTFKKETVINKEQARAQTIDKALMILQMLSEAYKDTNFYPIFYATYSELKKQGIHFPTPTKDESLTIFTGINTNNSSAMGSVPKTQPKVVQIDRRLPMIRPIIKLVDVTHPELVRAQDMAAFLFDVLNTSEVGMNLYAPGLVVDMVNTLKVEQENVQKIALNATANELDVMHAFAINDLLLQVLEDYEGLASGKKRHYEEELNISKMVEDINRQDSKVDDHPDSKVDDQVSNQNNNVTNIPIALEPPPSEPKRQVSSKKVVKSDILDLENINGNNSNNNNKKQNKQENDDDLLSFLSQPSSTYQVEQSLDPLSFLDNPTAPSQTQTSFPLTGSGYPILRNDLNNSNNIGLYSNNNNNNNNSVNKKNTVEISLEPPMVSSSSISMGMDNINASKSGNNLNSNGNTSTNTNADKPKESNPFDTLDDPFSSMGSIKPTDPANNPFYMLTNTNNNGEDFDTGDDPFANFP